MPPTLGIFFALLVGFIAVEVWNNFDKAKGAVATEAIASCCRRLSFRLPELSPRNRRRVLINRHIEVAVIKNGQRWGDSERPSRLYHGVDRGTA